MDKKIVDWALENGYLDRVDEVDTLDEIGIDIVEGAYEYLNGLVPVTCSPIITTESGERVFGKSYKKYFNETKEEAIQRELMESSGLYTRGNN